MRTWLNFLGYQLAWTASVLGAAHGLTWAGTAACLAFAAAQWSVSPWRGNDLLLAGSAVLIGIGLDGGLAQWGLVAYAAPAAGWPAPPWILALWCAFALTLNHSLGFLGPLQAALLGAVGGPLAYWAAARLGAVALPWPGVAIAVLAPAWAAALAILSAIAQRGRVARGAPRLRRGLA